LGPDGQPESGSLGKGELLEVRRIARGDAPAVRELDGAAMRAAGARGRRDDHIDSLAATYIADGGEFLMGVGDERVVAMGALRHVTDTVAEINRMRVHPGSSGAGSAG
jgi:hypothetical protein